MGQSSSRSSRLQSTRSSRGQPAASTMSDTPSLDARNDPTTSLDNNRDIDGNVQAEAGPSKRPYNARSASEPVLREERASKPARPSSNARSRSSGLLGAAKRRFSKTLTPSPSDLVTTSSMDVDAEMEPTYDDVYKNRRQSILAKLRDRRRSTSLQPVVSSSQSEQASNDSANAVAQSDASVTPSPPNTAPLDDSQQERISATSQYTPGQIPMTPPAEDDSMLDERQRMRHLIQTVMSAQTPADSQTSEALDMASIPIIDNDGMNIDDGHIAAPSILPILLESSDILQRRRSTRQPSTRSQSFSSARDHIPAADIEMAPSAVSNHEADMETENLLDSHVSAQQSGTQAANATPTDTQPSANVITIPRRILVQGIVASSPNPTPAISRAPTPIPPQTVPVQATSRSDTQLVQEGDRTRDNALDDERTPLVSSNSDGASSSEWDNAVDEVVNAPPEATPAPQSNTTDNAPHEESTVSHQAHLIGRLLSIAAASTAATLLPGLITLNGSVISGFDEDGSDGIFGSMSEAPRSTSEANANASRPRSDSTPSTVVGATDTTSTSTTANSTGDSLASPRNESQASPSGNSSNSISPGRAALQQILRNALASAFGGNSANESGASSATSSSLSDSSNAQEARATENRPTIAPTVSSPPASRNSRSPPAGAVGAVSVSALASNPALVTNRNAHEGTFERFLADLQFDVATAILSADSSSSTSTTTITAPLSESMSPSSASAPAPAPAPVPLPALPNEYASAMLPLAGAHDASGRSGTLDTSADSVMEDAHSDHAEEAVSELSAEIPPADVPTVPGSERPATATPLTASASITGRPFSFFRSFRFPARSLADLPPGSMVAPPSSGTNSSGIPLTEPLSSTPTQSPPEAPSPVEAGPHTTPASNSGDDAGSQSVPAVSTAGTSQPAAETQYVPLLLIGVRSLQPPTSETTSASAPSTSTATVISATSSEAHSSSASAGPASAHHTDPLTSPGPSAALPAAEHPLHTRNPASRVPFSGFSLWIMGGVWPAHHPIALAPSLVGDGALSYEDMLRLADILGQHKPPTASADEVEASGLSVVKGTAIGRLQEDGKVLPITAERCLVCLEDYADDEDVRVLACQHCFHKNCVDRWLVEGANNCPACRTVGVKKAADAAVPPPAEPTPV
ncbi:hypothetical protein EMMF5_004984 [Cystobasidiomycetes sp. EMM_F5]